MMLLTGRELGQPRIQMLRTEQVDRWRMLILGDLTAGFSKLSDEGREFSNGPWMWSAGGQIGETVTGGQYGVKWT